MKKYWRLPPWNKWQRLNNNTWLYEYCAVGYTLYEIALVLALVISGIGVGSVCMQQYNHYMVRLECEKFAVTCQYLQMKAMTTGIAMTLTCNKQNNSYQYEDTIYPLQDGVIFGVAAGVKGPPSSPTHAITNPITFVGERIEYQPHGAVNAGTIYLTDAGYRSTYAVSYPVSSHSYGRMYHYAHGWKKHR